MAGSYSSESAVRVSTEQRLSKASLLVLSLLVFISALRWVPAIGLEMLSSMKHGLLLLYCLLRAGYHIKTGKISSPINSTTLMPVILAVLFAINFTSDTQSGLLLDYILIISFGYVLIAHFSSDDFSMTNLNLLLALYVVSAVVQALYSLGVSLTSIPTFPLPAGVVAYSRPYSILGFSVGSNDFSTTIAIALLISIYKIREVWVYKISTLILASGLTWGIYSTGHGRAGVLFVLFGIGIYLFNNKSLIKFVPVALILPVTGWFLLSLIVKASGAHSSILWLNELTSHRFTIYYEAFRVLFEHPTGIGFDNFPEYFRPPPWDPWDLSIPPGPHNTLLRVSMEVNVFAGILMLYWILAVSNIAIKKIYLVETLQHMSAPIVVLSVFFVGLSVGRVSPFHIYIALIWWICFAAVTSAKFKK